MKTMVLVGDDKLGRQLASKLRDENLILTLNRSVGIGRVIELVMRGTVKPAWIWQMAIAEASRPVTPIDALPIVVSNAELLEYIETNEVSTLYLYRAGLVVNRRVLDRVKAYNVHCARIPDYGGLGAIPRALRDGALSQCATLHRVTETIDVGEVIATEAYELDRNRSYRENEDIAYGAGMRLILKALVAPEQLNPR